MGRRATAPARRWLLRDRRGSASPVCWRPLARLGPQICGLCRRVVGSWSASSRSGSFGSCWSRSWWAPTRPSGGRLLEGAAGLAEPVLRAPDVEADAEPPFSALHGLYWLVANLAAARPLLVVVDDVQWADLASLRWLVYLARRLEGMPLGLLLATRPAEAGSGQVLLDELVALPEVGVLYPGELSEGAVAGLAAELLAGEPDREFVAACRGATGGNPFLLRELLGELERRGVAPGRENADLASRLSSQGVGRAVRARLRRLGPECTALAHAVALLGDPAEPALAARLAGLDGDAALRAAHRLVDAAILEARPVVRVRPPAGAVQCRGRAQRRRARRRARARCEAACGRRGSGGPGRAAPAGNPSPGAARRGRARCAWRPWARADAVRRRSPSPICAGRWRSRRRASCARAWRTSWGRPRCGPASWRRRLRGCARRPMACPTSTAARRRRTRSARRCFWRTGRTRRLPSWAR